MAVSKVEDLRRVKAHTIYHTKNGKRVPSTTTVINATIPKPYLVRWANQQGLDGIDSDELRDAAGDVGTCAHLLVTSLLTGQVPDVTEFSDATLEMARVSYRKFDRWITGHKFDLEFAERSFVSEEYLYGGTMDIRGTMDGLRVTLDLKTGKDMYREHPVQLAAYDHLVVENGLEPSEKSMIIRIGRNPSEPLIPAEWLTAEMDTYWQTFVCCRTLYELLKQIGGN